MAIHKPLTHGFWVPREKKDPAWITVKYERLQNFCYRCGCLDHEIRNCMIAVAENEGESESRAFGNWISTPAVRTLEEAVESCKEDWMEAQFIVRKNTATNSHRKWSPEMKERAGNFLGSSIEKGQTIGWPVIGSGGCQEEVMSRDELVEGPGPEAQVDFGLISECVVQKDFKIFPSTQVQQDLGEGSRKVVGPISIKENLGLSRVGEGAGGAGLGSGVEGPAEGGKKNFYRVEFPGEHETACMAIVPNNGLSPISSMAVSLSKVHLKRPYEAELELIGPKRARKLDFEETIVLPKLCIEGHQNTRGRRRSHRGVKTLMRQRRLEISPGVLDLTTLAEVEFPASWVNGDIEITEAQSPDSAQNAGGWMGPTTSSP
ncbi:hypothetical protein K1719_012517 [Acacia pycnantha]|nr:hypothetical protein K1719_012517 [Acacia pycnantha]